MSVVGQKRTWKHVQSMSALPPKTDIGTQPCDVRFVPKADEVAPQLLFDHLVGTEQDRRRYRHTNCLGGFQVEREFETRWLLDGKIGRLCSSKNLRHERRRPAKYWNGIDAVRHQSARLDIEFEGEHRRRTVLHRQIGDTFTMRGECGS